MNEHELHLAQDVGDYLADGACAAAYRLRCVETAYGVYETIVFNFEGVRGMNSSFANALIVPLFALHGTEVLKKIRFRHCNPNVRVMIESALTLGVEACHDEQVRV